MDQGTPFATYRAITNTHMVQVGVDFEPHSSAMTGPLVGLSHGI